MLGPRIDRRLNIVLTLEREDGNIYVHSMPISREVFERHFLIISKTYSAIIGQGLGVLSGPRICKLMLQRIAEHDGNWEPKDGSPGVKATLLAEITRLSNVVLPGDRGWQTMPLETAINRQLLDEEEIAEVEGALVFFTCVSAILRRATVPGILAEVSSLWPMQTTLSNVTEWTASLPTLTETETSPAAEPTGVVIRAPTPRAA